MPSETVPVAGLNIEHADFEWLRGYLQRDMESTLGPPLPELNEDTESDSGSTVDDRPAGRKRAKTEAGSAQELDLFAKPFVDVLARLPNEENEENSFRPENASEQKPRRKVGWTSTEDLAILATVRRLGTQWGRIAAQLPGRTADAVRNRWHRLQKTHSLGDTEEGRAALDALLLACGISDDWQSAPDPTHKSGGDSSCIKGSDHGRAMWMPEEDALIEEGVRRFGCKWRQIASSLPGRSDSSVRNRWMRLQKEHASARGAPRPAPQVQLDAPAAFLAAPRQPAPTAAAIPSVEASLISPPGSPMVVVPSAAAVPLPSPQTSGAPRPPPFLSLKRRASSRRDAAVAAEEPLGFRSPMLGFDLDAFVEAVSGAIDEEEELFTSLEATAADDGYVTFEVSEVPVLCSERMSASERPHSERRPSNASELAAEHSSQRRSAATESGRAPPARVPPALVGISSLLTAVAALTIGASLLGNM